MPSADELATELRNIAKKLETNEDQLIRDLIEIKKRKKHNSGTSIKSRRDFMERVLNQYLIDNVREFDE